MARQPRGKSTDPAASLQPLTIDSLGVEPVDRDVMKQPPRKAESPIITRPLMVRVLTAALIIVSGTM